MHPLFKTITACIMLNVTYCDTCKRTVEPEIECSAANTVLVPQDMKDRFFFKEGTYWIYKNITTNETDSMWVWESTINIEPVNPKIYGTGYNKCYEYFYYKVKNLATINSYNYYSAIGIDIHPIEGESNNELFGINDFYLPDQILSYRVENRGGVYENQMGETMLMLDSIVTKDNLVFKNILRLYYSSGGQISDYLIDTYYAKNIGLVKFKRRTDNTEWELIRSHIIQ